MKKITLASILSLALLVAFGLTPSISSADGKSIKFEVSLEGTFQPYSNLDSLTIPGTLFIVMTTGTGNSIDYDLGEFEYVSSAAQHKSIAASKCVPICHKGKKTLCVSKSALKAHLGHGDTFGPCPPPSP